MAFDFKLNKGRKKLIAVSKVHQPAGYRRLSQPNCN